MKSCNVHVAGAVQGVGFRPYTWALARRLQLAGWVRNDSSGVEVAIEGTDESLQRFIDSLQSQVPPLARVDAVEVEECTPRGFRTFEIRTSRPQEGAYLPVCADVATCEDCLRDIHDPADRRYQYPFTNCTNCGPRFTIVQDIPYDRSRTTMSHFELCEDCRREYSDPSNRRFHAQPTACPRCGPQLWLQHHGQRRERTAALAQAAVLLRQGAIVAIKGLGGFHLACRADDEAAVRRLRQRKHREEKPLALMAANVATIRKHVRVDAAASSLLQAPQCPVVLMPRRATSQLATSVAPGRKQLGFMLPYTPLHHLLFDFANRDPDVLVMTSGNRSDEPIAYSNAEAIRCLGDIADAFLLHDRPIHMRNDDSVCSDFRGQVYLHRRARGYAPLPVILPFTIPGVLAMGGELKNTFCVTRDNRGFMSHHIGDLQEMESQDAFKSAREHYQRLFRIKPQCVAHDLHPDYHSTREARRLADTAGIPAIGVQHHHAHVAACMADCGLQKDAQVIGVAFDGTGFGTDGAIWGGEFLLGGYAEVSRPFHLRYCPLPGGDHAIRKPYRTALSWLHQIGSPWEVSLPAVAAASPEERRVLSQQIARGVNTPQTSSIGRLFDAVASLIGVCHVVRYEAQAACELEALCDVTEKRGYPFAIADGLVDPEPLLRELLRDFQAGVAPGRMAMRFHNAVAAMVVEVCRRIRRDSGVRQVVLSGGVWQNMTLLRRSVARLEAASFQVLVHHQVPANDGGLALGQAMVAAARLQADTAAAPRRLAIRRA